MTTYYTIHCYDQESKYRADKDLVDNHILYKTFERACDAIEERIRLYESEFESPNREDKAAFISKHLYLHYYENEFLFVISKMTVEKIQNKYVYQYWVENKICGLHTKSEKYASFDEACDAMDMELRELHEKIGKPDWNPRMTREEFKKYIDDGIIGTYDFFDDGGSTTEKYVLCKQDA